MAWIHRPLESPRLYNAVQKALGAGGRSLGDVYERGFGRSRGAVLDVGCGPVQETPRPRGRLVGLDVNPAYVADYVAAGGGPECVVSGVVASATRLPFGSGTLDECRCSALLHHLPDDLVRAAVGEMHRVVRRGGRIAIFDMVRPPRFADGPLAWILCALDRGRHVRTADSLVGLVCGDDPGRWAVERFDYAWPRLHGVLLTTETAAADR